MVNVWFTDSRTNRLALLDESLLSRIFLMNRYSKWLRPAHMSV